MVDKELQMRVKMKALEESGVGKVVGAPIYRVFTDNFHKLVQGEWSADRIEAYLEGKDMVTFDKKREVTPEEVDIMKKALEVDERQYYQNMWNHANASREKFDPRATNGGDERYLKPKVDPKATHEEVAKAIEKNLIYSRVKELMLKAQEKQVAYGMQKYPETLNPDSWGTIETIDHIIEETVDQLHYMVMLKAKMEEYYKGKEDTKTERPTPLTPKQL